MKKIQIADGVTLHILPNTKMKTDYVSVAFVLPLEAQSVSKAAIMPKMLMRGSIKHPSFADICKTAQELYATELGPVYTKRAGTLLAGLSVGFIKDRFLPSDAHMTENALTFLFEVLLHPLTQNGAFSENFFESEKNDHIHTIRSMINNKAAYAKQKLTEKMFAGSSLGLSELGTVEGMQALSAKDAYAYYLDAVKYAPVIVSACGEFDEEKLTATLKKYLPDCSHRKNAYPVVCQGLAAKGAVAAYTEKMDVSQGKLVLGYSIDGLHILSDDTAAFLVFNEMFGGSPQSKLFVNVREKQSLCYYCKSSPDFFSSAVYVQSGIRSQDRDRVVSSVAKELADAQNGDFTDADIADAKRSLINSYREMDDNVPATAAWYASRALYGVEDTPENTVKRIADVTREQIVAAGKKMKLHSVFFLEGNADDETEA